MESADWDKLFRALTASCRRELLVALLEQDDGEIDPLEEIAPSEKDADQLKMSLVHRHLPMLEDTGYIEWNRGTGKISRGSGWGEIAPVLQRICDHCDSAESSR